MEMSIINIISKINNINIILFQKNSKLKYKSIMFQNIRF